MAYKRRRAGTARRLKACSPAGSTRPDTLRRRAVTLLEQPLDTALLSERETRDGRLVQYIEGWTAIAQANRIFGFDAWGAEVVGEVTYRPLNLLDPDTGERLAVGMYAATVKVTVHGCLPRVDVGCAFAAADTPEAHEAAFKGAVTDGMKRALRTFGAAFGNELYGRRSAEGEPQPQPSLPPMRVDEMRRRVIDLSARLGADETKARAWAEKRYGHALDGLTPEQLADAVHFLADRLNRRNGAAKRPETRREAALAPRRLVRRIETRAGPRYVVQVPREPCPAPGWRAYVLLALGLDGEEPVRLTLYERTDDRSGNRDGPRAA